MSFINTGVVLRVGELFALRAGGGDFMSSWADDYHLLPARDGESVAGMFNQVKSSDGKSMLFTALRKGVVIIDVGKGFYSRGQILVDVR